MSHRSAPCFATRSPAWIAPAYGVVGCLLASWAVADTFPDTVFVNGFEPCVGVQCFQVHCPTGQTTSVSGIVTMPNGTLPLPNVEVYVPGTSTSAISDGPAYDRCGVAPSGHPVAATLTAADGSFTLRNVPATTNVPLVMLAGKWRREVTVGSVPQCTNTPLAADVTRMPRNHNEGHIPHLAVTTGSADAIECSVRNIGIDDTEFTTNAGSGRVHLYAANGASKFNATLGGATFAAATTLWSTVESLSAYDEVMFGCEGAQNPGTKPQTTLDAFKAYLDAGGRAYTAHWGNYWIIANSSPWPTVATWNTALPTPSGDLTVNVNASFPQGALFYNWLYDVGASASAGTLTISNWRQTAVGANAATSQIWLSAATTQYNAPAIQMFSFTTPVEALATAQKGRMLFTDMHPSTASSSNSATPFPNGCSTQPLAPQEKALLYAAFDLQRCVGTTKE